MILIDRIDSNRVYVLLDKKSQYLDMLKQEEINKIRTKLAFDYNIWFFPLKEIIKPSVSVLKCDTITKNQYKRLLKRFKESEEVKSNGK